MDRNGQVNQEEIITVAGGTGRMPFPVSTFANVIAALPQIIKAQLRQNEILVAGGFIRDTLVGLTTSDIDVFCKNEEKANSLSLEASNGSGLGITKTDCSFTLIVDNVKIQYVYCRPFSTPESLLTEFDFTCCCVSLHWSGAWVFTQVDTFQQDTADRMLVFRCADYNKGNLGALSRAFRFTAKGWYMPQREMAKLVHHYVAYAPAVRRRTSRRDWQDTSDNPTDTPMISLEAVQQSVNPMYNARSRSGRSRRNTRSVATSTPSGLSPSLLQYAANDAALTSTLRVNLVQEHNDIWET